MPNFGLLYCWLQRTSFVTLNIFKRKFSVDFTSKMDWFTEFFDLVALIQHIFFTDKSLWGSKAGADVFSKFLNVRESYAQSQEWN
jgi:hypothetical protein